MGRVISMDPQDRIDRLKEHNAELQARIVVLERQLEQARNLATRRIVAYGERGMVKITPDGDAV